MPLCWHDRPADSPDTQKMIWCFGMLSVIPSRNFSEETKAQELLGFLSGVFKVSDWLLKKMTIPGHRNSFEFSCQNDSFHDCIIQSWNLASNDLNSLRWPQQRQMTSKCIKWPQNVSNDLKMSQMTSKASIASNDLYCLQNIMSILARKFKYILNAVKWDFWSDFQTLYYQGLYFFLAFFTPPKVQAN